MNANTIKFEFIHRNLLSCQNAFHFATVRDMIFNFQDATREEKITLLREFESERIKKGVYTEHIETPLSVNFDVYDHNNR